MDDYDIPKPGRVFAVKAWWLKGDRCVCRIEAVYGADGRHLDVKPLEGNPHARTIGRECVLERIGGHPAEI